MASNSLPPRAAIYCRVSTHDQSPESQLRDLRAYAQSRGFAVTEYTDAGFSGAAQSRPSLDRLMDDARKRKLDIVLCWRFDRFARSTKHLLNALEEFRSLGIQFISFQENIDTSSPLGQAIFTIVSAVAQLERDLIRERVRAGLRNAKAKGRTLGRPRVAVDCAQVDALRLQGFGWKKIAKTLGVGVGTAIRAGRTA
jgi:DNA invertase Pin-like site-specific DNA recombinase